MNYIWLVVVVLGLFGIYIYKKESIKITKIFYKLAEKYNGQVQRGVITYPILTFPYYDQTIFISAMPHEDGAFTYVSFNTNKYPEECKFKVISKSKYPKILEIDKDLRIQKINLEKFEEKYLVYANNSDYIIALLTTEICSSLLKLDQNYNVEVRYISLNSAFRFDLHIDHVLTSKDEIEKSIQTTKLFLQQMDKIRR